MCPNCRAFISTSDKLCQYCQTAVGPRAAEISDSGESLWGLIPHARFTTILILLINSGLYAATMLMSLNHGNEGAFMNLDGRTLFAFGAKDSYAILQGQWWRLVTAGFLHGGLIHILMNSWALFDLGAQVEEWYGSSRMIVFYLISSFCGFVASTYWTPALSVGASAGIFGLIGAMIALGVKHNTGLGSAIRGLYIRWAVYGLLFGLLPGFNIDNAAHIGGLAAGFGVAYFSPPPGRFATPGEKYWQIAAGVVVLLTAYCFLQMFLWLMAYTKMK